MTRRVGVPSSTTWLLILAVAAILLYARPAPGAEILVNTTSDGIVDDDGRCTLREAVAAANADAPLHGCSAGSGPDVIVLFFSQDHVLDEAGANEDQNLTGDFDIRSDITIRPEAPTGRVRIDAAGLDRVFDVFDGADLALDRVVLVGGNVLGSGGAVLVRDAASQTQLVRSEVVGNASSVLGGGIYSEGILRVIDSRVSDNASGFGGGIYMGAAPPLVLWRSFIADNRATVGGGGLNLRAATIQFSTIDGNEAGNSGGGLTVRSNGQAGDTTTLTNSTVGNNESTRSGGGIHFASPGVLELSSVTIGWNAADSDQDGLGDGGGLAVEAGSVRVRNTILTGNADLSTGGDPVAPDCVGTITSWGYNLVSALGSSCVLAGGVGDLTGTVASPLDAGVDSCLQDNGGSSPTFALTETSPALDSADPAGCLGPGDSVLLVDQRGFERLVDGPDGDLVARCDRGAVEAGGEPFEEIFEDGFESGDLAAWGADDARPRPVTTVDAAGGFFGGGGGGCGKLM
ncbi:MAG: choice-of-anchor Q domain-containing protein [Acidobacteriota bacterium]